MLSIYQGIIFKFVWIFKLPLGNSAMDAFLLMDDVILVMATFVSEYFRAVKKENIILVILFKNQQITMSDNILFGWFSLL